MTPYIICFPFVNRIKNIRTIRDNMKNHFILTHVQYEFVNTVWSIQNVSWQCHNAELYSMISKSGKKFPSYFEQHKLIYIVVIIIMINFNKNYWIGALTKKKWAYTYFYKWTTIKLLSEVRVSQYKILHSFLVMIGMKRSTSPSEVPNGGLSFKSFISLINLTCIRHAIDFN